MPEFGQHLSSCDGKRYNPGTQPPPNTEVLAMCLLLLLTGATILLLVQSASSQPLLDRVLDRVQDELDGGRAKPIPIEQDQPAPAGDPLQEEGGEEPGY